MKHLLAPEKYNIVEEMEQFATDEQRLALIWENEKGEQRRITYRELFQLANRFANVFTSRGLQKGDRVLILMPRLIETYALYIACLKAGLVVIPSNEMLRAKDLSYRINHGEAKAIAAYAPLVEEVEKITEPLPTLAHKFVIGGEKVGWASLDQLANTASDQFALCETSRDDWAFLSYTSGTTGNPKGVVHTHSWGYAHLRIAAKEWLDIKENDIVWATAGPGWQKWIWSPFVSVLGSGATGFSYNGRFDPEKYLQLMDQHKINVLCCTPTEYRLMAKVNDLSRFSLSSLRSAVSAGEPLNREVIDTFEKYFGITVRDGYGQTENSMLVGNLVGMKVKPGSMGKPVPGNRVEIIDEDGNPVGPGVVGDIAIHRSVPTLFKEYYKDPERTKAAYRGEYYLTGDQAYKDEEGYFWFHGRSDDVIISSGYTIGPFEVEDALVKHPAVKECAVVASPDEIRGHVVKAFIVLKDGFEGTEELIKELQEHVKTLTAPYKYPRRIEFVSDLPKTASGKIRRVELRAREMKAYSQGK